MLRLSRLLVPIDFSASSRLAASEAATLAAHFESRLTLLHIAEFPNARFSGPLGYGMSSLRAMREEFLAQTRKELDAFAFEGEPAEVQRILCCGDPAKAIVDRAHAENADLIVMATHGYGPVRRLLLGSVTAKVLHDSDRPVWTTRAETEGAHAGLDIRHVMCAASFRSHDGSTIRWAAGLANRFGAKLTVVHAILPVPPEMPERYAFTWHEEARWGADERLRTLLVEAQIPADVLVVEGDAPAALASTAAEKCADVLVLGRDPATSMSGRLGSQSYGIVCHAPCPVICL